MTDDNGRVYSAADDKLLAAVERAHALWESTPRWRLLKRLRRENAWLELCRELQEREVRAAKARLSS